MAIQKSVLRTISKTADIRGIEVTVYVPSTVNMPNYDGTSYTVIHAADAPHLAVHRSDVINRLKNDFTLFFGGATTTEAFGSYRDNNGNLIPEAITRVSTIVADDADNVDGLPIIQYFESVAKTIARIFSQESVLVTYTPIYGQFVA